VGGYFSKANIFSLLQTTSEEVLSNMADDLVDVPLENIFDSF